MDGEALVRDYLARLDAEARRLPPDRRSELLADVRAHIDMALAEAGSRDEAAVRTVLDRLGPPSSIVEAELPPMAAFAAPGVGAVAAQSPRYGLVEIVALLLLTVGGFVLPFVGPLAGLIFVWMSPQWETRHKVVASVIVVGLMALAVVVLMASVTATPGYGD